MKDPVVTRFPARPMRNGLDETLNASAVACLRPSSHNVPCHHLPRRQPLHHRRPLLHSVWPLISLLFLDGANEAISRAELPAPNSELIGGKPELIPRIIHQTYITKGVRDINGSYHDSPVPEAWIGAQQSCKDLHKDYEYKFWVDTNSRDFIEAECVYSCGQEDIIDNADILGLSKTPRSTPHISSVGATVHTDGNWQRCHGHETVASILRQGDRLAAGVQAELVLAVHHHHGVDGPALLQLKWRAYNLVEQEDEDRVRVLLPHEYMSRSWSFFSHHTGNSWHMWGCRVNVLGMLCHRQSITHTDI
ncbi:hypothetical protein MRB53_037107 [Persea americana]|nr:hypothetical protein MRB53_037107 [Persea americana]